MNFSKSDFSILMGMTICIICMSLVFPHLGLSNHDVNETNIPEFNISKGQFNFADTIPDGPGAPSSGEIYYQSNKGGEDDSNVAYLDAADDETIILFNNGTIQDPEPQIFINTRTSGGDLVQDEYILSNVGDTSTHNNNSYEIFLNYTSATNIGQNNMRITVFWKVLEQPQNEGWASRIPILGGIFDAGESLAGIVGWIGSIILWGVTAAIEFMVNFFVMFFNVVTYFIDLLVWLITSYSSIVSAAPGAAKLIAALPGLLLGIEFAKLTVIMAQTIWIG